MRDAGIDDVCELVLCFVLVVQNMMSHIHNLQKLYLLVVTKVLFNLHLQILRLLVLASVEFEHEPLSFCGIQVYYVLYAQF